MDAPVISHAVIGGENVSVCAFNYSFVSYLLSFILFNALNLSQSVLNPSDVLSSSYRPSLILLYYLSLCLNYFSLSLPVL